MLVKVYIDEDGNVCREDNDEVIGKRAFCIGYSFWKENGGLEHLLYGYYSDENNFCELCQLTSCSHECLSKQQPNCRYSVKDEQGFYFCEG